MISHKNCQQQSCQFHYAYNFIIEHIKLFEKNKKILISKYDNLKLIFEPLKDIK